jgi:hypothetical protein
VAVAKSLEELLGAALDDEYHARAYYRAVLAAWGEVRPFSNIVESEERHIEALARLYRRYDLEMPEDSWPARISTPESLEAACEASLRAERENGVLYEELMASETLADYPDVEETFRRLATASQQNHLPAFERALERERGDGAGHGPRGEGRRRRHRHRGGRPPRPGRRDP